MMGRREQGQGQLFYEFSLDEVVPPDHLVRRIDAVFDLGWVHKELEPHYSHTGRPFIDPELDDPDVDRRLRIRRSGRSGEICAEVHVNLAIAGFGGRHRGRDPELLRAPLAPATSGSARATC